MRQYSATYSGKERVLVLWPPLVVQRRYCTVFFLFDLYICLVSEAYKLI